MIPHNRNVSFNQEKKRLVILGSTGSIGQQTLSIISEFPEKFEILGLSCQTRIDQLQTQIRQFKPPYAAVHTEKERRIIMDFLKQENISTEVVMGEEGLIQLATLDNLDMVIVAIVGTASLRPTYEAIMCGKSIGLACKEVLVSAGDLIMSLAQEKQVPIIPIDSEHSAIKHCLDTVNGDITQVNKVILTASGGPFLTHSPLSLKHKTPKDALKHPNWKMGPKITIDSATLMNKGLEVIEAHHLFHIDYAHIEVVIHPQSIIHSLVEFKDGTLLSQMGLPDMRFPIQAALTYPERIENPWPKTSLSSLPPLTFQEPDTQQFPLLSLAYDCGVKGGSYPAVLNAANEACVQLFLKGNMGFTDIFDKVMKTVTQYDHISTPTLEEIILLDQEIKDRLCQKALKYV